MDIDMSAPRVAKKRRHAIMNRATLLDKGIHIPNLNQFMWIWTKQNYNKHVETMEN
jgi:hypothetical protein